MNYLDYAATSPLDEEAANIYVKVATEHYGNSNSLHDLGEEAHRLLEGCREEFSNILGVKKEGIYFTSGGTESNFLSIEALLSTNKKKGNHIITCLAEHSSIQSSMDRLKQADYEVTYLPFNSEGIIDIIQFQKSIKKETVLVVIQHGNSEIGTIQPIAEIGKICMAQNILLHTDCVQTFGKVNLKKISSYVDSLSISGHKFYGPKGTGLVYIRPQLNTKPFFPNTTHEKGFRPGTVNVPGIAAMTYAARKTDQQLEKKHREFFKLRNIFIQTLQSSQQLFEIYGSTNDNQLPGVIGMSIEGIEGQWVMNECNQNGFAISTGSACHTGLLTPALTMTALGFKGKKAKEFFRISMGRDTSEEIMGNLADLLISFKR